ncbi:MAG: UDP-N-acetylglucosamine 1-carboxyvinyltransferase [Firmicutes bacterium]|nr:UDP-N-acetylglucosamine 1-carboxyvinyltransferase [Bacillota bacterium]
MERIYINGGNRLHGKVEISGAKNAAVALIPAALLADDVVELENVPHIADISSMVSVLKDLGVSIHYLDEHTLRIDSRGLVNRPADSEGVRKMRASYYLLGVLLGRFGSADVVFPGGCNFGIRPIDLHLKGFESLGATVEAKDRIQVRAEHLHGANIFLDVVSVGATINIMLAAVLADGTTVISNAAKEPHVVDTANFLNSMGANISGAGTDRIVIRGVRRLHGTTYQIIPDQIEAGTYMVAAAITGGDITVRNIIPKHMDSISAKLLDMGAFIEEFDDAIRVCAPEPLKDTVIKTAPYPGFPTDMQPQFMTLMSVVRGTSIITENVWDNRFQYVTQLHKLGADISVDGRVAVVKGVDHLDGCEVEATDLRAGAAMVLAGLAARGTTVITNVKYISRGYEAMVQKLVQLGADIRLEGAAADPIIVEGRVG